MDENRFAELLAVAQVPRLSGADAEQVLARLREVGAEPMESLEVLRHLSGMNLTPGEARPLLQ